MCLTRSYSVLGFAGMILAVIAILLPIYLFWQIKMKEIHYEELRIRWLILLSIGVVIVVIACELSTMLEGKFQ